MPDKAMLPTSDDDDGKKKDSVFYTSAPGPDIQCLKSKQSLLEKLNNVCFGGMNFKPFGI